jgi:hypothetical protein
VVLTNFERGQKAYAAALTRLVTTEDKRRGDAAIFRDPLFETIVVRSSVLLTRLYAADDARAALVQRA